MGCPIKKSARLSDHQRVQKFYLIVFLVEVTSVAQLVDKLKKGKYRSCEDILQQSKHFSERCVRLLCNDFALTVKKKSASDDDEIVAGPQKMSLKCPVSSSSPEDPAGLELVFFS